MLPAHAACNIQRHGDDRLHGWWGPSIPPPSCQTVSSGKHVGFQLYGRSVSPRDALHDNAPLPSYRGQPRDVVRAGCDDRLSERQQASGGERSGADLCLLAGDDMSYTGRGPIHAGLPHPGSPNSMTGGTKHLAAGSGVGVLSPPKVVFRGGDDAPAKASSPAPEEPALAHPQRNDEGTPNIPLPGRHLRLQWHVPVLPC